jgi:hypothetical protein
MIEFNPDAFLASGSPPAAPSSAGGFDPDAFLKSGTPNPPQGNFDPDAFLDPGKAAYISQQQQAQNEPILQRAGDFVSGLANPQLLAGLGKTAKAAVTTLPQLVLPTAGGASARQNLINAGLLNAADTAEAWNIQSPRFADMFTGGKETPEQLGQDYETEKAYQNERGNIQQLGSNPAISQQLSQQTGLGRLIGDVSGPGGVTVSPDTQNALEPIADPSMYIPFGGAAEGLVKGGLGMLGRTAAEDLPKAGLTATLAGKTASAIGSGMAQASGWKDGLNSTLQSAAQTLFGNEKLSELAGEHGTQAILGYGAHAAGLGELGAFAGFAAPQALKKGADFFNTAGKVLQEGEGTVPFFERMAQESAAQGNPLAAKTYQLIDASGLGSAITSAAKISKNAVKATAFTAPYQLPLAGNDPQQAANTVMGNLAFGALGGALHQALPMTAADFQKRQDFDFLAAKQKLGPAWDNAVQLRAQTVLDRMSQSGTIDPANPNAQLIAAQAARQDMGAVASMMRSNPQVGVSFDPAQGNKQYVTPDGRSMININPTTSAMIPQVIAHELVHHIQSSGQRPQVLQMLLGDPETKEPGILRSYSEDGTPVDSSEFQTFRQNYDNQMAAQGQAQSFAGKASIRDQKAAEEFYSEAVGSILGGHTNAGELNYARLRRSGIKDNILGKFLGGNKGTNLKALRMGFMDNPDGTPSGFDASQWLNQHPELKQTTLNYVKSKAYLGQMMDKEHEFSNEFGNEEMPVEAMKKNPNAAYQRYGNDLGLRFSPPDKLGNRTFEGILSKKQEEKQAQDQANELLEALKTDPKYFRTVTRADGKEETQIIHVDDKLLSSLRHLNEFHKDNMVRLNDTANVNQGNVARITYQPALSGGKRYKARERTVRTAVPYDIFISQPEGGKGGANILTHILDVDQMAKNRAQVFALMQKAGLPVDPKFTDDRWFQESLQKMAQAHYQGKKSTDGTGLSDEDRDFLNATMGVTKTEGGQPAEGVNHLLDTLKIKAGTAKLPSAVKSFRLDRINKIEPSPEYGQIPFQYPSSKVNRRPEEETNLRPDENPAQGGEESRQNEPQPHNVPNGKGAPQITPNAMERGNGSGNPRGTQPASLGLRPAVTPKQFQEAYIEHIGRSEGRSPDHDLIRYAKDAGNYISPAEIKAFGRGENKELQGGDEHRVFYTPENGGKIIKITKPDSKSVIDTFGNSNDEFSYLDRIGKMNALTKDKLGGEVIGVTSIGKKPAIVTRYNALAGDHPTDPELKKYLEKYGWRSLGEPFEYHHSLTGVHIRDAAGDNFIKTKNGHMVPIDIHVEGDVNKPMFRPEDLPTNQQSEESNADENKRNRGLAGGKSTGNSGEQGGNLQNDASTASRGSTPEQFNADFKVAKSKERIKRDDPAALLRFAQQNSKFIPPAELMRMKKNEVTGGQEHEVYVLPDGRILKITRGQAWGLNGKNLSAYLKRMQNLNLIAPSIDARVEGVTKMNGFPALVTSMNEIRGLHPTQRELSDFLSDKGFTPYGSHQFHHAENGLKIGDAHPKNFIKRPDGTMVPIDITFHGDVKPDAMFRPEEGAPISNRQDMAREALGLQNKIRFKLLKEGYHSSRIDLLFKKAKMEAEGRIELPEYTFSDESVNEDWQDYLGALHEQQLAPTMKEKVRAGASRIDANQMPANSS